ncbi:MAG: hypothetical protein C0594_10410, partial [Marinilabiliales bacterium]
MSRFVKHIIFVLFLSSFGITISAQELDPSKEISQYSIQFYSKPQGLPIRGALSVHQDQNGYVWFATYSGLVRFDGLQMSIYNTKNIPVIQNNGFTSITETQNGDLYFASLDGLITLKNNKWSRLSVNDGLPSNVIEHLFCDNKNTVWIGTVDGLCFIQNDSIYKLEIPELKHVTIQDIYQETEQQFLIATSEHGLIRYFVSKNSAVKLTEKLDIRCVGKTKKRLLVGTSNGLFQLKDNQLIKIEGLPSDQISAIYTEQNGAIWIGTYKGLSRIYSSKISNFIS